MITTDSLENTPHADHSEHSLPSLEQGQIGSPDQLLPEVQSLIDSHAEYQKLINIIPQIEAGATSELDGYWSDVAKKVSADIENVRQVQKMAGIVTKSTTLTAEDLGNTIFNQTVHNTTRNGTIVAEQQGPCLIIKTTSSDDFTRLARPDNPRTTAQYHRKTFAFNDLGFGSEALFVPTIECSPNADDESVAHEINHYSIDTYTQARYHEPSLIRSSAHLPVVDALDAFSQSPSTNEDALRTSLATYSEHMKLNAIDEMVVQMMASGKPDYRQPYTDTYFKNVDSDNKFAKEIINEAKTQFTKDVRTIQEKTAGAIQALANIEKDAPDMLTQDEIIGTVVLELLKSNDHGGDKTIQNFDFLNKIKTQYDFSIIKQEIYNTSGVNSTELLEQLRQSANTHVVEHYGYAAARKAGASFSEALAVAGTHYNEFMNDCGQIRLQLSELVNQREARILEARLQHEARSNSTPSPASGQKESTAPTSPTKSKGVFNFISRFFT